MATICPGTYLFKRGEVCSKKKIKETKYSSAEILTWLEPDERKLPCHQSLMSKLIVHETLQTIFVSLTIPLSIHTILLIMHRASLFFSLL